MDLTKDCYCMHSSKICNLCSNNFKKQKATEADPCFISNNFKPFYDPNSSQVIYL